MMTKDFGIGFPLRNLFMKKKIKLFQDEWSKMTDSTKLELMNKQVESMGRECFSVETINAFCEEWWEKSSIEKQEFVDEWEKVFDRLSMNHTPHIWANPRLCRACGRCIKACPKQVIGKAGFLFNKRIVIKNAENCSGCKKCIQVCPYGVFSEKMPDTFKRMTY